MSGVAPMVVRSAVATNCLSVFIAILSTSHLLYANFDKITQNNCAVRPLPAVSPEPFEAIVERGKGAFPPLWPSTRVCRRSLGTTCLRILRAPPEPPRPPATPRWPPHDL